MAFVTYVPSISMALSVGVTFGLMPDCHTFSYYHSHVFTSTFLAQMLQWFTLP